MCRSIDVSSLSIFISELILKKIFLEPGDQPSKSVVTGEVRDVTSV